MAFSQTNKTKIKNFYTPKKLQLLTGTLIKTGDGRPTAAKEANYLEIQSNLTGLGINNRSAEVVEAAGILAEVLGRAVEVQEPPNDNGAARKLAVLQGDSSTVQHNIAGVDVRLDIGQLKHQHPSHPIGTRHKGGGNRFNATCDAAWHQANSMAYMAGWANGLAGMVQGEQRFHGQATAVANVHYEGYCLLANGRKYVLFHCYPSDNSPLRGPNA